MNNRFKFRVWDIEDCTYFEPRDFDDLWLNENAELRVGFYSDATQMIEDYTDNVVIEQCTGLKDNCGNLIYEGDIIGDGEDDYVIKWDSDRTMFVAEDVDISYEIEDVLDPTICVIGNIHEQAEQKDK